MPLQDYSASWTASQFELDLVAATAQAGGDTTKVPGLLNNKGWSMNQFDVRDYVASKHPDLYKAWQSKYGSFFKMDPMWLGLLAVAFAGGFYLWNKYSNKSPEQGS